jgi:Ser/Thr protein kinase RdoA (MazF antagonist)
LKRGRKPTPEEEIRMPPLVRKKIAVWLLQIWNAQPPVHPFFIEHETKLRRHIAGRERALAASVKGRIGIRYKMQKEIPEWKLAKWGLRPKSQPEPKVMDDVKLSQKIEAYEKATETDREATFNALRQYILDNDVTCEEVQKTFVKQQQMPPQQAHLQALRVMKVTHQTDQKS